MTIYSFHPTWLMIKRHKITGLLYFCKTSKYNPKIYLGSGKYWKLHLKKHGKLVETIWMELFNNREDLIDFAILFSELHNIVEAKNNQGTKIWANLEIENGISGMPIGTDRGEEFRKKCILSKRGEKNPSYGSYWINDGVNNRKVKGEIPEGWTKGRVFAKEHKQSFCNRIKTGKNNPLYDNTIYSFKNTITDEIVSASRHDFAVNILKISSPGGKLTQLIRGQRKTMKKWTCIGPVN